MKITIDTKEDSADEIKRVIHLLNMLIDGNVGTSPILKNGLISSTESKDEYMELPNVGNFMEENEKKEEDKPRENPTVMTY